MRVAALYDIHGNLPALEAVLAEVRAAGADRIVVGGDVLPGPMPRECLDLVLTMEIPTDFVMGNADRETIARQISNWPLSATLHVDGLGAVLFCHATPRNDAEIFTSATSEEKLRPIFEPLGAGAVVCGHVHMQFDRMIGATRVVNAGSVGMPFDAPGAYWLLLGSGIELRRTDYDLQKAAERVRRTRYPQADVFATNSILNPPTKQMMNETFSKAELS